MGIGKRIREAREMRGFTQKDLADKLGVTSSAIANYENNVSHPKEPVLYSLLDVLGVDANFLFQDEMHNVYTEAVSLDEMETIVKKYRKLDDDGKELIKSTLDYLEKKQKSVIKFPQRAPDAKVLDKSDDNTIDFPNMTPLKISEQSSAAGLGVYLGPESFTEYLVQDNELIRRTAFAVPVSGDSMEPKFHDGDIALVNFEPAEPGDIVVVTMDGLGYIKKLGEGVLLSLNKKYKPIPMKEDIRVNGKVIGILDPEWF